MNARDGRIIARRGTYIPRLFSRDIENELRDRITPSVQEVVRHAFEHALCAIHPLKLQGLGERAELASDMRCIYKILCS